ncbi:MAG: hypothetical protein PVJ80_02520 [Gemmatimonadota bacterium]|jgi:hypothetical protein
MRSLCKAVLICAALLLSPILKAEPAAAQLTPADSASVLLETARVFEEDQRWDVAEALYRLILDRYGMTTAAAEARARLVSPPDEVVFGDGSVELSVWMTLYGAWLGVAIPGALGADSPEPYGVGLLAGGPTGFLVGRKVARSLSLTEGQARAITLGGTWGTWQGFGWREVFDWGVGQRCQSYPDVTICSDTEDSHEEQFASMIVGGLAGIATGALLSNRDITPGTGTAVNYAALWGTWFGVAGGVLADLEDDDLLAAALIGGDVALVAAALTAPGWNVTRSRARLVSIGGILGGLAGAGLDLLIQPDSEKAAIAVPLIGSIAGLGIAIASTRNSSTSPLEASADGSLLRLQDGRLGLGMPLPTATLVPADGRRGPAWKPALGLELFRASF